MTTTTIDSGTKVRLNWIADQLVALYNNGYIRYEGDPQFRGAQTELADIIATATEPAPAQQQIVQNVMTQEQVQQVMDAIPPAVSAQDIVTAIGAHIEQSDVSVLDAIAHTRADVLAAIPQTSQPTA